MKYRHVGSHAEDLADGRILAPGETVDFKGPTDPHNQRLIDDGILLPIETPKRQEDAS